MHTYLVETAVHGVSGTHLFFSVASDWNGAMVDARGQLLEMAPFVSPRDAMVVDVWIRTIPAWVRIDSDNDDFYVRHGQTCPMYN